MFNLHTFGRLKYFALYFEYKKDPFYYSDGTIEYIASDEPYYLDSYTIKDKNITWWTI